MKYQEGLQGVKVTGKDIDDECIEGIILQVGKSFGVAVIKTGSDRLDSTTAFLNDIEIINK